MKFLPASLVAALTAAAATAQIPESWSGELQWTLYAAGKCEDDNLTIASGATTSLVKIGDALCETDETTLPDGSKTSVYTKFDSGGCGSESSEVILYNCFDDVCGNCTETPEVDGILPNFIAKEVYNDPQGCLAFYPKGNASFGGIVTWESTDGQVQSSQAFDSHATASDTQAYWEVVFGNLCGEPWFQENVLAGPVTPVKRWEGELPWTLYDEGGCSEKDKSNISATGATISLVEISPEVLCEVDHANMPDGSKLPKYTKMTKAMGDCGIEKTEFIAYDCVDEKCSNCSKVFEADAFITNSVIKDVYYNPSACFAWESDYENISLGTLGEITGPLSAQAFDPSVALADSQAYWSYLFENICGEDWFDEYIVVDSSAVGESTASPSKQPTGSAVSFGVIGAILVVSISSAVLIF